MSRTQSFKTLSTAAEALIREKGSKFYAFAWPVRNEQEIKEKLEAMRKKYFDASHHCYAYVLGADKKIYRANDDGEPNHSAGDPILGQIRSLDLSNVLVLVLRYFGGRKLGVGGLIQAYRAAAAAALANGSIVEEEVKAYYELNFAYAHTPDVMRLIKMQEADILSQQFEAACSMKIAVKIKHIDVLLQKIDLLNKTGTEINISEIT